MRKLIVVALASSSFGGVIGALASAAAQSQASPQAVAAAAQRVQDTRGDAELATLNRSTQRSSHDAGLDALAEWKLLTAICNQLSASSPVIDQGCFVNAPPSR